MVPWTKGAVTVVLWTRSEVSVLVMRHSGVWHQPAHSNMVPARLVNVQTAMEYFTRTRVGTLATAMETASLRVENASVRSRISGMRVKTPSALMIAAIMVIATSPLANVRAINRRLNTPGLVVNSRSVLVAVMNRVVNAIGTMQNASAKWAIQAQIVSFLQDAQQAV